MRVLGTTHPTEGERVVELEEMDDPLFGAYEARLILLLENEDYTGFRQVMLTKEQFKKVSDAAIRETRQDPSLKDGYDMVRIELDEDRVLPPELFDGMNSINEE